jgi:hypothetical protein
MRRKREQYYFDLLEPNYNICTVAGSTLGRLHRAEKKKISKAKIRTKPLFFNFILFSLFYLFYYLLKLKKRGLTSGRGS